ncbi:hypothetical protein [Pseudomonas sp. B26(2017)]|uniref:hypothetical protein n=1 Tax=Pseudomonas sp. B26(2017) TaxID=1981732 RepID=UPI000A1FDEED|nr:hypothetical protein [Pseudomonas sp. B26(2017)]
MKDQKFSIVRPVLADFRYAVYCGSTLLDLQSEPESAVALFADRDCAIRYCARMWPATFAVVDLEQLPA